MSPMKGSDPLPSVKIRGQKYLFVLVSGRRRNRIAREVGHPNFRTVKDHRKRSLSGCISRDYRSARRTHFHQRAVAVVDDPKVRPVKKYSRSSATDVERAEFKSIGSANLRNGFPE